MVVIARTFVRAVLIRKPGLDDYSMVIGMVFTLAYLAEIFVGKANHIGFPSKDLSLDNMTNLLKNTLAIQVTYYVCISAIKISILCMYLRFGMSFYHIMVNRFCADSTGSWHQVAQYSLHMHHCVSFVILRHLHWRHSVSVPTTI